MSDRPSPVRTGRGVLVTALAAGLTVVGVDRALTWRYPPPTQTEVEEGIAWLQTHDPTVLAIGSSHGRTFEEFDRQLALRTSDQNRCAAIAVEFGKLTSYLWVLENRVLPILDTRPGGRGRLRHLILITEWWDSTVASASRQGPAGQEALNVPSRGWLLPHFLDDLWHRGIDDYNRNYLQTRWGRLWGESLLVRHRGFNRVWQQMRGKNPDASTPEDYALRLDSWRQMIEGAASIIAEPHEMAALRKIVAIGTARDLEVTVLLYPRKPGTLTEQARAVTLRPFAAMVTDICREMGAGFLDHTWTSPLTDADFANDFDHVRATGNETYCRWLLEGDLSRLTGDGR